MLANDDERLLAELRRIVTEVDPVPEPVQIAARNALRWRTGEFEQARLVGDASIDGPGAAQRTLTFAAAELTIELTVQAVDGDGSVWLAGRIIPALSAEIMACHNDELIVTRADDGGHFSAAGVASGPVSLRCRLDDRLVETERTML